MTPARFRWGMILIFIGVVMFLSNFGIIFSSIRQFVTIFFPLLLISVGIEKIFTKTKLQFISYLTTFAMFLGGLIFVLTINQVGFGSNFFSDSSYSIYPEKGIEKLHVTFRLHDTDLTVRDSGYELVYSDFDRFLRRPKIEYEVINKQVNLSFTSRENSYLFGLIKIETGDNQNWNMRFSDEIPLDLVCYGDYSDIDLNLASTPTRSCKFYVDETDIYLRLGDILPHIKVLVSGEDSKLRLRVPQSMGIKIFGDKYKTYLTKIGLKESDGYFINSNYEDAEATIEVDLKSDLRSFRLDFF